MNNSLDSEKQVPWNTPPPLWSKLRPAARKMRRQPTIAEAKLWQRLRNNQVVGRKFRRQHTLGQFVVDFYCAEARFIIEVDGPIHDDRGEEDSARQQFLEAHGFKVLRFSNDEVNASIGKVLDKIRIELTHPHPHN